VYRALIRRRVVSTIERLSTGDYKPVVAQLAPDVHHVFAGDSALGGERPSRVAVERWSERLFRLFPRILDTTLCAGEPPPAPTLRLGPQRPPPTANPTKVAV
jgi:hypothetical protein